MELFSIFANFYIDTEERFIRMQDSFRSMKPLHKFKWTVNIRGAKKDEAETFLNSFGVDTSTLCSPEGWFHDSKILSEKVKSEYVLLWVEDHICLQPEKVIPIVDEMSKYHLDIFTYSFWNQGQMRRRYVNTNLNYGNEIDWFEHTVANNAIVQSNEGGSYLISYISIMSTNLFKRVLFENNRFRWPKETPFDFEIEPDNIKWLPLRRAVPRYEVFAQIDDDHGVPGSCLISRGAYPNRVSRHSYAQGSEKMNSAIATFILQNVLVPGGYLTSTGWVRSLVEKRICDLNGEPLPSISYPAIYFLSTRIQPAMKIFEYGSGFSTLWWSRRVASVVSCEHDIEWYNKMRNLMPVNVRYDHIPLEYGGEYSKKISEYTAEFDIIIIDGRDRVNCVKNCIFALKNDGIIILDNAERKEYSEGQLFLMERGYKKIPFFGLAPGIHGGNETALFYRENNVLGL